MATIGGVGSNNYVPGVNNPGNVDGPNGPNGPNGPTGPGGLGGNVQAPVSLGSNATGVAYSQPSPLDHRHLVLPASINDSTNVDITACLVLLVHTAMEMRKDQREEWIKEAQNALGTADTAADMQKQAAQQKFIGDCVTNGIQIGVSVGQACCSIGEMGEEGAASSSAEAETNRYFGSEEEIKSGNAPGSVSKSSAAKESEEIDEEDPEAEGAAKSIISEEGLSKSSIGGEEGESSEENVNKQTKALDSAKQTEAKEVAKEGGSDDESLKQEDKKAQAVDAAKQKAAIDQQLKERASFKATTEKNLSGPIAAKYQVAQGFLGALGSAGKLAGAAADYQSSLTTADAAKEKALADFQNTTAQTQLDFSNDLKNYTDGILSTIRDIESARHAASNAIANI